VASGGKWFDRISIYCRGLLIIRGRVVLGSIDDIYRLCRILVEALRSEASEAQEALTKEVVAGQTRLLL